MPGPRAACGCRTHGHHGPVDAKAGWIVRSEEPQDAEGIDRALRRAFDGANAADLVRVLRAERGYDPALSMVAVSDDDEARVIGHVLFSPIAIVQGEAPAPALALGPLGVLPDHQHRGVGRALVEAGLAACREAGHRIVLVLGDPGYYERFGFVPASRHRIRPPHANWTDAYQVLGLEEHSLDGVRGLARYPAAWEDV